MADLQEATGVHFEIAFEKFKQDLEDVTRNQKGEVCIVLTLLHFETRYLDLRFLAIQGTGRIKRALNCFQLDEVRFRCVR